MNNLVVYNESFTDDSYYNPESENKLGTE